MPFWSNLATAKIASEEPINAHTPALSTATTMNDSTGAVHKHDRKFFGPETTYNMGTSYLVPTWILAFSRLLSSLISLGFCITCIVFSKTAFGLFRSFEWVYILPATVYLLQTLSFAVLCGGSVAAVRNCEDRVANRIGSPLYQTAATLSLFTALMSAIYSSYRTEKFALSKLLVFNAFLWVAYNASFSLIILDFFLGARLHFRLEFMLISPIVLLGFSLIAHSNGKVQFPMALAFMHGPDHLGWLIGLHFLCVLCSLVVCAFSRINGCIYSFRKNGNKQEQEATV